MQALLDDLRKDLDMIAGEIAVSRNRANQERRAIYRLQQQYQKVLTAVKAVEEELENC